MKKPSKSSRLGQYGWTEVNTKTWQKNGAQIRAMYSGASKERVANGYRETYRLYPQYYFSTDYISFSTFGELLAYLKGPACEEKIVYRISKIDEDGEHVRYASADEMHTLRPGPNGLVQKLVQSCDVGADSIRITSHWENASREYSIEYGVILPDRNKNLEICAGDVVISEGIPYTMKVLGLNMVGVNDYEDDTLDISEVDMTADTVVDPKKS